MTETEIASAGVQPDAAPDTEIATAMAAQAPFNDRELHYVVEASSKKGEWKETNSSLRALFQYSDGSYWATRAIRTADRSLASIRTVESWWETVGWDAGTHLEILRDTPKEPRADVRKSDLAENFTANFIGLIEASPQNPQVRAHMMKVLKQMPPEELDTFEKLKDWVEQNFFASAFPITPAKNLGIRPPARPQPRIEIGFTASETEVGRCRYEVSRSGTFTHEVTVEELTTWIAEGKDIGEILEIIEEEARQGNYDMETDDDYSYDEHESHDTTNEDFLRNTSEDLAIERIRDLLSEHAPESLETLDNN